jgi:hypothetical protein
VVDRRIAPWLVVGAVAAAYANAFAGTFQFDDGAVIVGDPRVRSLAAWWAYWPGIRPLLKLSYAANHASGLGLAGFHAVNVALQAVNGLLVLAIFRRLSPRLEPASGSGEAAALVGALLFALHPAHTEAVTYLSGRSSSLAAALALGSILAWMRGRDEERPALAAVASPALLLASLGVKETAVGLPVALVLLLVTDARRRFSWREAARATAPHWLVLAAVAVAFLASPTYGRMLADSRSLRPPGENLLVHASAVAWLAGQVVRPDRLNADPDVATVAAMPRGVATGLVGLAAAAAVLLVRRRPSLAFGVLWFLIWIAPAGWAVPRREPASDRQLYLALAGPAWLAGCWLAPWAVAGGARRAAVAALVVALGASTAWRNRVYAHPVVFWEDVVAKSPGNARAHNNLGYALAGACRIEEAEAALARAIELDPGYVRAGVNLRLLQEGAALGPGEAPCPRTASRPSVP